MNRIFSKDGFQWFVGVVEDRQDPKQIGRCKVRIYGHHSINKDTQPTKDLPWAIPIQPITSAAISGVGGSPVGPLPGTWVVGFYLDGADMQQPAFFGTIGADTAPTVFEEKPEKPNFQLKDNDDELKDESGKTITKENKLSDGTPAITKFNNYDDFVKQARNQSSKTTSVSGVVGTNTKVNDPNRLSNPAFRNAFPVKVGNQQNPNNPEPPNKPSTLPPVIKKSYTPPNAKASGIEFSVNDFQGRDTTTKNLIIASNKVHKPGITEPLNGPFGKRYGLFKFASFMPQITEDGTRRPSSKTSPLVSFLTSEFAQPFKGLFKDEIGSDSFDATWRNNGFKIADSGPRIKAADRIKFAKAQVNYIRKIYVDAVAAQVIKMGGPSINSKLEKNNFSSIHLFSLMLNNALDLGIVGAAEIITKACEGKSNLSKADIVELVTEYMIQNSDELLSKLPQEERDTIKVDQLNQREELKKVEIPPFTPPSEFGDFGTGFNFSVGLEGTPDEKLVYNGNSPTVYDRINNERIRRGLPRLANPRPTGEGNREVKGNFGQNVKGKFGSSVSTKNIPSGRY